MLLAQWTLVSIENMSDGDRDGADGATAIALVLVTIGDSEFSPTL